MNIVKGLTGANLAFGLFKDIKEIDSSVDEAAFKLKRAEISNAQADGKISLSEAKETLAVRSAKLDRATKCDVCPKCCQSPLQLLETLRHAVIGFFHFGVEVWKSQCDGKNCAVSQKRIHDPHCVVAKAASGEQK